MKKVALIVNPSSGGEKATNYESMAKEKLEKHFDEVVVNYTEKAGDAIEFAKQAAENRFDSVFVMGGDGTVNEGISGLAQQEYRPNFGFFPLGTVNDLARALNIPLEPQEAINSLDFSKMKKIDIGKVNDKYFMNVVGAGTIPEAINDVETEDKTKWGKMAYFISSIKQFSSTKAYKFKLTIDGETREIQSSIILVGLTNSIGGFEHILPDANVNDGKLHMIYLKDPSIIDTLKAIPELIKGVDDSSDNLEYITFEKAVIEVLDEEESVNINVDGDEGDSLPVKVSILPSHLNVYCGTPK